MNIKEREDFWKTLLSANNESDLLKVQSNIKYPDKFYRYRFVNIRTLNALSENKLYFSTSNYYDDPFDSFIHINYKEIKEKFKSKTQEIQNKIITSFQKTREMIRQNLWSVCFTENYYNENLWLKYADSHKGIVLEYDSDKLRKKKMKLLFDKFDTETIDATPNDFYIYPVVYSDQVYDATTFATNLMLLSAMKSLKCYSNSEIEKLVSIETFMWEIKKILLNKRIVHHYDEEWRLILTNSYLIEEDLQPYVKIKPTTIILGLNISKDDKKAVLIAAEKAGINDIEQIIIDDNDEFVAKKLKI